MEEIKKKGPKGGICRYCERPVGGLVVHERFCIKRDWAAEMARMQPFLTRAAAHTTATPRAAQRWRDGVTDEHVATVMFTIEADEAELYRNKAGRWLAPRGFRGFTSAHLGSFLSTVVNEMIRTGLLRHVVEYGVDYLVPARVHLRIDGWSACRFTGEDLGPMRSRLVDDLSLVDCLNCEDAVARGTFRRL